MWSGTALYTARIGISLWQMEAASWFFVWSECCCNFYNPFHWVSRYPVIRLASELAFNTCQWWRMTDGNAFIFFIFLCKTRPVLAGLWNPCVVEVSRIFKSHAQTYPYSDIQMLVLRGVRACDASHYEFGEVTCTTRVFVSVK